MSNNAMTETTKSRYPFGFGVFEGFLVSEYFGLEGYLWSIRLFSAE